MKTPAAACLAVALLAALAGAAVAGAAAADVPVTLRCTKDNSIVMVDKEWRDNGGSLPRIRAKGNQHIITMMFDTSPLAGRLVKSAVLVCRRGDADIPGVTLSTIQTDWDEKKSNALTSGMQAWDGWGYPGARFPALAGGNAFSLVCHAATDLKDGTYSWEVQSDLVHAIAVGAAWGLAVHEHSGDYSRNPTIYSRESSGKEPALSVILAPPEGEPAPDPPTDLRVSDRGDPESLRLSLRAPRNGFAYDVTVNGKPLPRWNIPFVRPGQGQVIPIRDLGLQAGAAVAIEVVTLNRLGARSAPARVTGAVTAPKLLDCPAVPAVVSAGPPPERLVVIPLEDKYDAAGKPVGDLPVDYAVRNEVFDGRTVRLAAARGEVVGFQALVRGEGKARIACDLRGLRVDVHRAVYVEAAGGRRIPDPLVPLPPSEEVALSPAEALPVCVDVFVPFDFKERTVEGAFTLSDGRRLPVHLEVRDFALPREAAFACEMNGYGLPNRASEFYRLQEIAYDHRTHANLLSYSHSSTAPGSRKANLDMVMDGPAGDGSRRMGEKLYNDIAPGAKQGHWDDFVATFGPYLSGRCFAKGHRGPVQPPGFYLTFHESWPLKCREFFNGNPDAYEAFKGRPQYAATFVNVLKDFIAVAQREGWTRTGFQVYLNNKGSLKDGNRSPWILDEPVAYWDYRALAFFDDLVRQARGPADPSAHAAGDPSAHAAGDPSAHAAGDPSAHAAGAPARIRFRIDISRPEFDRGQLWGKADLWVCSTSAFHTYPRLVADRAEQTGERIWVYGTSNKVEETNRTLAAWVLDAYRGGAWGVVPWQTVNKDGSAMTKADQLGLFIFTKAPGPPPAVGAPAAGGRPPEGAGPAVIHHSMRLKAYRRAEQDVEYLELARTKLGLAPAQVRALMDRYLNLAGTVTVAYAEDAGTPQYQKITPEALRQLREVAAALLAKQ